MRDITYGGVLRYSLLLVLANISAYYGVERAWGFAAFRAKQTFEDEAANSPLGGVADNTADAAVAEINELLVASCSAADTEMYKLFGYLSYPKVRLVFCCTLTLPLALMVNSIPDVFRGKDNTRFLAGQGMKLMEVYLESLPQSLLQGFIILQVLYGGTAGVPVDWKQWTSLAISIISLAFSIAMGHMCAQKSTDIPGTDQYPVKDPSSISQAVFFVLGGLSISARILVCSLWALISKPLWCVPCLCNVAIAVTFWCTRRFYTDSLSVYTHNMYTLSAKGIVTFIWITTALFNGFTPSGAFVSAGNLSLAVGGYFLVDLPDTNVDLVCIIAIVLSTVSLAANLLVILVPAFRRTVGDDWLLIDRIGRSTFY